MPQSTLGLALCLGDVPVPAPLPGHRVGCLSHSGKMETLSAGVKDYQSRRPINNVPRMKPDPSQVLNLDGQNPGENESQSNTQLSVSGVFGTRLGMDGGFVPEDSLSGLWECSPTGSPGGGKLAFWRRYTFGVWPHPGHCRASSIPASDPQEPVEMPPTQ